ncbi:MAG: hypothetical protein WA421_07420 [Nitrososphaeraceae archaeon]
MKNLFMVITLTLVMVMLTISSIATSVFSAVISSSLLSGKLPRSAAASLPSAMTLDTHTTIKDILLFII